MSRWRVEKSYMKVGLPSGVEKKDSPTFIKGRKSFCSNCHNLIRGIIHRYKGAILCKECYLRLVNRKK